MTSTSNPSAVAVPGSASLLKPPLDSAIPGFVLEIIYRRPQEAIPCTPEQRIFQLRKIFAKAANMIAQFVVADVVFQQNGEEHFKVSFNHDPQHPVTTQVVRQVIDSINEAKVRDFLAEESGLNPKFIEVKKITNLVDLAA